MRIDSIQVTNYRSFGLAGDVINFPNINKPISIIGKNNSGKTTLISSILMSLGITYIGEDKMNENDFFMKDSTSKIKITTAIHEDDETLATCIFESKDDFNESPYLNISYPKKKEYKKRIFYFDFNEINKMLKIKTDWSYTILGNKIKQFREEVKSDTILFDVNGESMTKIQAFTAGTKNLIDSYLKTQSFNNFVDDIKTKLQEQLQIRDGQFDLEYGIIEIDKIISSLTFYISESPTKPLVPIDNMGNGYKALFVIAIIRAISEIPGSIFILEEPETFLHESYQEYFYSILKSIALNNQVIYTTHSKKFIDIFDYRTIIKLKNTDTGTRTIQNTEELSQSFTQQLDGFTYPEGFGSFLKTVEPSLGAICFSDKVIIVEGPHDVIAYKTALDNDDVLQGGFSFNNISIIPAHSKDIITLLAGICRKLEIPYYIIHDYDLVDTIEIDMNDNPFSGNEYKEKAPYNTLTTNQKQQYTKNIKILKCAQNSNIHVNKPKLEGALNFELLNADELSYRNKSTIETYTKLVGKSLIDIRTEFPNFIPDSLLLFINENYQIT